MQSFELDALRRFAEHCDLPCVLLLARAPSAAQLRELRKLVHGIRAAKSLDYPRDATGAVSEPTVLVREAHALGLAVHAWTFRSADAFLPVNLRGRAALMAAN